MPMVNGIGEYLIIEILTGPGAAEYNYFFSLMCVVGVFAFMCGLLVRMISRS